jgi:hypothetical protein
MKLHVLDEPMLQLIGTTATVDGVRDWIESCRDGVVSLETKLVELRPSFPGMKDAVFGTRLEIADATTRTITRHELQRALDAKDPMTGLWTSSSTTHWTWRAGPGSM